MFINIGINLLNNQPVAIKFESRMSDSPQLKDEYHSYKVLAGCGMIQLVNFNLIICFFFF